MKIRPLSSKDDRGGFTSSLEELTTFFQQHAGQSQFRRRSTVTYVCVDEEGLIVGYATVCPSELRGAEAAGLPKKHLGPFPVPVLRLSRMAARSGLEKKGIGQLLLGTVFNVADSMRTLAGCAGVLVDAKPGAVSYYERAQFDTLEFDAGDDKTLMFRTLPSSNS